MRRRGSSGAPEISGGQDARKSNVGGAAPNSRSVAEERARSCDRRSRRARVGSTKADDDRCRADRGRLANERFTDLESYGRRSDFGGDAPTRGRGRSRDRLRAAELSAPYVTALDRNVIAYVVDEISTSPHPVVSFDGARDAGWESGFIVAAHVTRSNPELEATTIDAIRRDPHVIGVIYSTIFTRRVSLPDELYRLPTVLLNCHSADRRVHSIVPGEVAGALHATEYLLGKGHRRIGFINGEPWMEASADRLKGYRQALGAADIAFDPGLLRSGDWLPLQGYNLTLELLRSANPPTAIFCANDLMAMGALEAAGSMGLRVPEDLSVMGYDDQELARYTHPPLSTLVLPNYEMGRKATEVLIDLAIHKKASRPMTLEIDGPLIERYSVGDCPSR